MKKLSELAWNDFKPIPELESYGASKDGRIIAYPKVREGNLSQLKNMKNRVNKSQRFYKARLIKQAFKQRYWYVNLMHNNIKKNYRVHRLIYKTYKGEIPENMVIDHIDGNTKNNNIDNLRCVTISENCRNPNTKYKKSKAILQINPETMEIIAKFKSISDAEVEMGKDYISGMASHIGDCCKGKRRTAHGFIWQYEDNWNNNSLNIKKDYRKIVLQFDLNNNFIAEFPSLKMAATSTGFKNIGISRCATGKQKSYKNYIWKYENL
jgi:hypothetical protein